MSSIPYPSSLPLLLDFLHHWEEEGGKQKNILSKNKKGSIIIAMSTETS